MSQIEKLYQQILANPGRPISFAHFERLLRAFGFEHARTKGSHRQYVHPSLNRPFPVQPSVKEAKPYQVRELLGLIEEHGLSIER